MSERFESVDEVSTRLRGVDYLADPAIAGVVFLADRLGKPVLVEGPAGVGKQRLALRIAADHGARDQAGEIGALADELAKSREVLGNLVERLGVVRQLEEGAGIASGDA